MTAEYNVQILPVIKIRNSEKFPNKVEVKTGFYAKDEEVYLLATRTKEGWLIISKTLAKFIKENGSKDVLKKECRLTCDFTGVDWEDDNSVFVYKGARSLTEGVKNFIRFYTILDYVIFKNML